MKKFGLKEAALAAAVGIGNMGFSLKEGGPRPPTRCEELGKQFRDQVVRLLLDLKMPAEGRWASAPIRAADQAAAECEKGPKQE